MGTAARGGRTGSLADIVKAFDHLGEPPFYEGYQVSEARFISREGPVFCLLNEETGLFGDLRHRLRSHDGEAGRQAGGLLGGARSLRALGAAKGRGRRGSIFELVAVQNIVKRRLSAPQPAG